jgi:Deoxycytidylate deaminase
MDTSHFTRGVVLMTDDSDIDKWDARFLDLAVYIADWSKDPSTKVGAVWCDPTALSPPWALMDFLGAFLIILSGTMIVEPSTKWLFTPR